MAVRIVSLLARVGLDGTGFQQGLRKLGAFASSWTGSLKSQLVGAFGATAVVAAIRAIGNEVGRIKDLSEQFGVTTDEVQRLDAAAKMSGQSFEDVGAAMERFNKAQVEAADGNTHLQAIFERFGSTFNEFVKSADDSALIEVLGRRGTRLKAIVEDLKDLKLKIISEEDIALIDRYDKKVDALWLKLKAFGARQLAAALSLSPWDFVPGLAGMPEGEKNKAGETKDEVAAANARRHFQEQKRFEDERFNMEQSKQAIADEKAAADARQFFKEQQEWEERMALSTSASSMDRRAEIGGDLARTQFQQVGAFTGIAAGALTSNIDRNVDSVAKDMHEVKRLLARIEGKQPAQKAFFG